MTDSTPKPDEPANITQAEYDSIKKLLGMMPKVTAWLMALCIVLAIGVVGLGVAMINDIRIFHRHLDQFSRLIDVVVHLDGHHHQREESEPE